MAATELPAWKLDFIKAALGGGILKFGTFELKSKRISPYFFNAGNFYSATLTRAISVAFARAIAAADLDFDVLFGPAYKGIPLAAATVDKLPDLDARYADVCYAFDRKEAKDHGEGGSFVGAPLRGKRVLIVDDVVTDGTAKREAIDKIRHEGGVVVGIVVALDRQEKLKAPDGVADDDAAPRGSAIGQIQKQYGFPVLSIITFDDIIDGVKGLATPDDIKRMEEYRAKYKATD